MWVALPDWMVVDGAVPPPRPRTVLTRVGLRIRGDWFDADSAQSDRVSLVPIDSNAPRRIRYRATGTAGEVTTYEFNTGSGPQIAGSEFVLRLGAFGLQAQVPPDVPGPIAGSRLTIEGPVAVVGDYEWEAFDLSDTRADWWIRDVVEGPLGDDIMLDVEPVRLADTTR